MTTSSDFLNEVASQPRFECPCVKSSKDVFFYYLINEYHEINIDLFNFGISF